MLLNARPLINAKAPPSLSLSVDKVVQSPSGTTTAEGLGAMSKRVPSMSRNKAQRATSRLDAGGGLMDPVVM